jgi:hypothetical protein
MFDSSSGTRVRGLVLAAVCAAALGLAACGDDDDDDATTPATSSTTSTEALETTDTTSTDDTTEDTTDTGETTTEDSDDSGGDVADILRDQLEAAGIQSDQADCVIDELESRLSEDSLEELRDATQPPQEVIEASQAAAQECLTK